MMTTTIATTEIAACDGQAGGGSPCLVCGAAAAAAAEPFLDLGATALANQLPERLTDWQPRFPLRVTACRQCGHVQLADIVPPEAMFTEYLYVSSASSTLSAHFVQLAAVAHLRAALTAADLAVDIGSNDGSLLAAIAARGARVLGVDPAANLAHLARARGVETEAAYFDAETAARLRERHGPARLITATNSFPHIPRLHSYLEGIERLLAPDGVFVIEAHYLADLIEQNAFDTIYHEHVSYWALAPLERLLAAHSLEVFDVERLPVHHGQLRVWIGWRGARQVLPAVERLRAEEAGARLGHPDMLAAFAQRVRRLRGEIVAAVSALRADGVMVAGYGAPAKASTLLDYCGLGPDQIAWIADRNRLKQGRLTPGTGIPVVSPDRIAAEKPGVLVLFAWNFADEIMMQLDEYRRAGGRFLIPVPQVRLVG